MNQQIFNLINAEYNLAVTVTNVSKGYAVQFIDIDSQNIIETRIYKEEAKALAYAKNIIAQ